MGIRRPNRQIEVFDISLMAVVTKAMGAFLVIMLLLMPYYRGGPAFSEPLSKLRDQIEDIKKKLEDIEQNVRGFTDDPEELKRRVAALLQHLDEAKVRMTELQRQLDQAWAQTERLEGEVTELQAMRQQLESQRDALAAQKAQLERDNTALRNDNVALKSDNAALRELDKITVARPLLLFAMDLQLEPTCHQKLRIPDAIQVADPKTQSYHTVIPDTGSTSETSQRIAEKQMKGSPAFSISDRQSGHFALSQYPSLAPLFKNKTQRQQSIRLEMVTGQRAKVYVVVSGLEAPGTREPCRIHSNLMLFFDPMSQWLELPPLYTAPDRNDFGLRADAMPQLVLIIDTAHPDQVKEPKPPVRLPTADDLTSLKQEHKVEAVLRIVPPGQL